MLVSSNLRREKKRWWDVLHEMDRRGRQRRLERIWDMQLAVSVDVSDSVTVVGLDFGYGVGEGKRREGQGEEKRRE